MFGSQDIPCATDVEVAHGDVEAASKIGKLFDGPQTFSGFISEGRHGWREQVAKRFFIGAPNPPPQLMQVAQSVMMGIVDDDGINIRNIQSRFNNGGGDQHIIFTFNKLKHHLLQFVTFHLAMGHGNLYAWYHALNHYRNIHDVQHPCGDKKHLSSALYFISNGLFDHLFAKWMNLGLHRVPVWRRCIDDRKIAGAHKRKLQGSRNWCGCEGQGIHIHAEHFHLFLGPNAKFLLFIHDQQSKILKYNILAEQPMCSDQDVDLSILQVNQQLLLLFGRLEPVDVVDPAGKCLQPIGKCFIMLQRQDGCWHQNCNLLALSNHFKRCANRDFGLSKPDISANQAVHRIGFFQIFLHINGSFDLVGRIFIDK